MKKPLVLHIATNLNGGPGRVQLSILKFSKTKRDRDHYKMLHKRTQSFIDNPEDFETIKIPIAPPGSPIGTEFGCTFENN